MGSSAATAGWLDEHRADLVQLVRDLVAFPTENRPPDGAEGPCQDYVIAYLHGLGIEPDVFRPDEVEGALGHAAWWPGRSYAGRPCVVGRLPGAGGGRSLLFSGHIDVVPATGAGEHGYWDGDIDGDRLYGRGSFDMKGGIACALHAVRCLVECEARLRGDLTVESVVDEEYGGANGTLACRLRGHNADGAVLCEPTGMLVCQSTRGGIQYRLHASGGAGGMGFETGGPGESALVALVRAAAALDDAGRSRPAPIMQYLLRSGDEHPWGADNGIPRSAVLEFWSEVEPGTDRAALDAELRGLVAPHVPADIDVRWEQRTRFLPALDPSGEVAIAGALSRALGAEPQARTAPYACDAFMFAEGGTPVAICGPRGGNAHAPDEYVVVSDLHALTDAYVRLALDWCEEAA
jgi:acetylornithine deacetylase